MNKYKKRNVAIGCVISLLFNTFVIAEEKYDYLGFLGPVRNAINLILGNVATAEEEYDHLGLIFTPVREEFVDELPEAVRDLPMSSGLPVVYRGAAKNWEAMNWTPEFLDKMGFALKERMKSDRKSTTVLLTEGYGEKKQISCPELSYPSCSKFAEMIKRGTQFREDYNYSRQFYPKGVKQSKIDYFLLVSGAGSRQYAIDFHEASFLAEFYGEKLVFLMSPKLLELPWSEVEKSYQKPIDEVEKKYKGEGLTVKDERMKMVGNGDLDELMRQGGYSPLQQVVLKAGDVLYIPAGWGHEVFYLTNAIGVSQQSNADTINWKGSYYMTFVESEKK